MSRDTPHPGTRPVISFCVTCRNRLWQLKETLGPNLAELGDVHNISLVDYGSTDGLSEWVWSNFGKQIENKRLSFFEVTNSVNWNVAKAKNLAHRLASGQYLFNLDADNWIVKSEISILEEVASRGMSSHQWSGSWVDGSYGRIGIPRDVFMSIGGYDEAMLPMGGQDIDLMRRIFALDQKVAGLIPPIIPAIQNTVDQKMAEIKSIGPDAEENYQKINQLNIMLSSARLELEGSIRQGGYSTFAGKLNGVPILIDGFNNIFKMDRLAPAPDAGQRG